METVIELQLMLTEVQGSSTQARYVFRSPPSNRVHYLHYLNMDSIFLHQNLHKSVQDLKRNQRKEGVWGEDKSKKRKKLQKNNWKKIVTEKFCIILKHLF